MPKIERIEDSLGRARPLQITRRNERPTVDNHGAKMPSMRIKCGDCQEAVVIYYDAIPAHGTGLNLEIGNVWGTVDQWRQILAPILGFEEQRIPGEDGKIVTVWRSLTAP